MQYLPKVVADCYTGLSGGRWLTHAVTSGHVTMHAGSIAGAGYWHTSAYKDSLDVVVAHAGCMVMVALTPIYINRLC